MTKYPTKLKRKQQRDLPELMERVTAACEARLAAGQKITHHAIGRDLGLKVNWTHYQWRQPAVALVSDYIACQRPADTEPMKPADPNAQGFFFDNRRGRNWAKPLPAPPLLKRCYFTGAPAPTWQILNFHKTRGWEHWCYASDAAVQRLRAKHLEKTDMAKTANARSTEELEAKLDEILADLSQVNPLNMNEIKTLGGFSASFLSGKTERVQQRRDKVLAAIKAERARRENQRTDRVQATRAEQEALIDAIHPELAPASAIAENVRPDQAQYIESLKQQLKAAQRRCEALQAANEQLAEQPAYKPPTGEIEAVRAQLQQEQESLLARLRDVEAELSACDRLTGRLSKGHLRVAS